MNKFAFWKGVPVKTINMPVNKYRNIHTGEVQEWHREGRVMVSTSGSRWAISYVDTRNPFRNYHELVKEQQVIVIILYLMG